MKDLFERAAAAEIKTRIDGLRAESQRQWGAMTVTQMLAHCTAWMEMATGLKNPSRSFIGRIVGGMVKKSFLGDEPIKRNLPTEKSLIVVDEGDFAVEQRRLVDWVERFSAGGPEGCTRHPHCFFGPMTPHEWAVMGYKHLDHHLKQFGA